MKQLLASYENSKAVVHNRIKFLNAEKKREDIPDSEVCDIERRLNLLRQERKELKQTIADIRSYIKAVQARGDTV